MRRYDCMVYGQSYTMTASTRGREVIGRFGENAETSQVLPVCSKTKQCFPTTAMFAWESSSVRAVHDEE